MLSNNSHKISKISAVHYTRFFLRLTMFLTALVLYIVSKTTESEELFLGLGSNPVVLIIIWVIFAVEMVFRFFPAKFESMGCQKQFKKNYSPAPSAHKLKPDKLPGYKTFLIAALWLGANAVFGALHLFGVYDEGILYLLFLFYAVCDMICVLFFCPFHTIIMKNKCCTTCRIYNWDFPMMFTPLVFIPNLFTYSLVFLSLILLIEWEVLYKVHPDRFTENTNLSLRCANCTEKACQHKKQLQHYLKNYNARQSVKLDAEPEECKDTVFK